MIKKIVITGPESSGKTTLAQQLGQVLETSWVPEFARIYIEQLPRKYAESDLLEIAKGQIKEEDNRLENANQFLICDTDLITIKIWSEYKYDVCDPWIIETIENRFYDLYLLCAPDIPWEYDPQRENPNDRSELYKLYKQELITYQKTFFELSGKKDERLQAALTIIRN